MTTNSLHPQLNIAIKAARAAGSIINRAALDIEAVRVTQKTVHDFVAEVDQACEAVIIDTILEAYPDHGIWAEESGTTRGQVKSDHRWIIDPLGGTTNFIHGFPVYCVSIAMQYKGKTEQAVIFDPARNDLFTSTKGRGAFMNDRRIRVSSRIRLEECLLSTGFALRAGQDFEGYMGLLRTLMPRTGGVRHSGASALDLAYVAAGFSDGFFERGLRPRDMAAGALLVTEAGGLIGNLTGESDFLHQGECLAANAKVYAALVPLLRQYSGVVTA